MLRSNIEMTLIELLSVGDRKERDAVYFGIGYAIAINESIKNILDVKKILYKINELSVIDLELLNDRTLKQVGLVKSLANLNVSNVVNNKSFIDSLSIGSFITSSNMENIDNNYKIYHKAVVATNTYINKISEE